MLIETNELNRLTLDRQVEPVLEASPGLITGMGIIPLIIAAIPAIAAAGMSIAQGVMGQQQAKKLEKKSQQAQQIEQQQEAEKQGYLIQLQQLQQQEAARQRNLIIYALLGASGLIAAGYGLKKAMK